MSQGKPTTYARIENNEVVEQCVVQFGADKPSKMSEGHWLPIHVECPDYSRVTHYEVRRENRIEADRVVRVRVIEPIEVTAEMIKAECQRRIIELTGASDLNGSLIKQIKNPSKYADEIARLCARSNEIEKLSPIPIDFRDDHHWA